MIIVMVACIGVVLLQDNPYAFAAAKGNPPVAHWRFDEGGGPTAYDDIGSSDGALNAGDTSGSNDTVGEMWEHNGKIGSALELDGTNDKVVVTHNSNLIFGTEDAFTISFWISIDSLPTDSAGIIVKGGYGNDYRIRLYPGGNLGTQSSDGSAGILPYNFSTTTTFSADASWNHCVLVYDGTNNKRYWYINGKEDVNQDITGAYVNGSNNLVLGYGGSTEYLDGRLDDVRIYDYARTAVQVLVDYNAGAATYLGAGTDPNEGNAPVGYWRFDENTGTAAYDRSGNGNNGTLTNDCSWTYGKYGAAVDFGGTNDYVTVSDTTDSVLDIASEITLEAWINPDAYTDGGGGGGAFVVAKVGTYYLELGTDKKPRVYFYGLSSQGYHSANSNIPLNTWTHLAATYNGSEIRIYINGILDRTISSITGSITTNNNALTVGSHTSTYSFDGTIDHVLVYNYARTPAQIAYDYSKGKPVAHYRFDEGTGTIAHNAESSANSGAAPVGWWRMDEASWNGTAGEVVDSSGRGNDGVRAGNATTISTSKIGPYAGTFDGTGDYVNVTTGDELKFGANQDFTVAAWVKFSVNHSSYHGIVGKYCDSATAGYWLDVNANMLRFRVSDGGGSFKDFQSSGTYNDNSWHHVVGVADRDGDGYLYIDGILINSSSLSTETGSTGTAAIKIGSISNDFTGLIDDVRIYDYARTAEQIYNDYKTTHGTFVGDTKFVDGKLGKALEFDGTGDYVNCGNSSMFDLTGKKTITFWAYPTNYDYDRAIGWCDADQTPNYFFYFRTDDAGAGTIRLYVKNDTNTEYSTNTYPYTINNWYFVAGIIDADAQTESFYVNGQAVHLNRAFSGTFSTNSGQVFSIGAMGPGHGPYKGKIDDVRIYNYARTAAQMMSDYNAGIAMHAGAATGEKDPWAGNLPIGHWKLDENTGILARDASGNNNDATLGGDGKGTDIPTWTQGKHGPCLSFDGDDYVDCGSGSDLNIQGALTMTCWAKGIGSTGSYCGLVVKGSVQPLGLAIDDGDRILFRIVSSSTNYNAEKTGTTTDADTWYHYAGVFKPSEYVRLYRNGVQIANNTTNIPATIDDNSAYDLWIGIRAAGATPTIPDSNYAFDGNIDEVRIYNYALTPAQVAWDYNRGKPVAHWRMDEATSGAVSTTAGAIKDDSAHDNDGTASDTSWSYTTGRFGGALSFDGDDYVSLSDPANGSLDFGTGDFSAEAWFKTSSQGPTFILAKNEDTYLTAGYNIRMSGGEVLVMVISDGTDYINKFGSTTVNDNNWHHAALTYVASSETGTLYLDGNVHVTQVGPTTGTDIDSISNTGNFYIGVNPDGSTQKWNGLIDDVRIYNYARTAEQIMQDYNEGMAAKLGD